MKILLNIMKFLIIIIRIKTTSYTGQQRRMSTVCCNMIVC